MTSVHWMKRVANGGGDGDEGALAGSAANRRWRRAWRLEDARRAASRRPRRLGRGAAASLHSHAATPPRCCLNAVCLMLNSSALAAGAAFFTFRQGPASSNEQVSCLLQAPRHLLLASASSTVSTPLQLHSALRERIVLAEVPHRDPLLKCVDVSPPISEPPISSVRNPSHQDAYAAALARCSLKPRPTGHSPTRALRLKLCPRYCSMLRKATADVVVVGAGVAGCSAFYHLARLNRGRAFRPLLVDALPPLSLTSANGSFSYRNWFPSDGEAPMRQLVVQSIDELDAISKKTNNALGLNRNGYLWVTRSADKLDELTRLARNFERTGGGSLRVHDERSKLDGYRFSTEEMQYDLDGCDLLVGIDNVAKAFPNLRDSGAIAALHVRRCGSLNPVKVANYELNKASEYCPAAQVLQGKVTEFLSTNGAVSGVKVDTASGETLQVDAPKVVFATGPLFEETLGMLKQNGQSSFNVPIINELHCRATWFDPDGVFPSTMPLTFDADPIGKLEYTDEERQALAADPSTSRMLEDYPSGVHARPYIDNQMMAVWTYDIEPVPAYYPVEERLDPRFPETCIRGLSKMFPQLKSYLGRPEVRKSLKVNGGYYCKTYDNRPLIGPAPHTIDGVYLQSAMTGVGLMSSGASGHLLASHVMGVKPEGGIADYVDAFMPDRFESQEYMASLGSGLSTLGQV